LPRAGATPPDRTIAGHQGRTSQRMRHPAPQSTTDNRPLAADNDLFTTIATRMRLLVTADLHYNHARSKALAEDLIEHMNAAGGDVLLVVGDTAVGDGNALEQCLSRFRFSGPKLFVAGNHE